MCAYVTRQLNFLLWFNRGKWPDITSMDCMWYMSMDFTRWSKQHSLVRANLDSNLVVCHQHQRELVECHKMCLPELQSLYIIGPEWHVFCVAANSDLGEVRDVNYFARIRYSSYQRPVGLRHQVKTSLSNIWKDNLKHLSINKNKRYNPTMLYSTSNTYTCWSHTDFVHIHIV